MESEKDIFKNSREAREVGYESKEGEKDPELQAAAAMERADYLVKEVKSSKQQMQNIVMHMMQVKQAIQQIRAQLQLQADEDSTSLQQDQVRIDSLKKKIDEYKVELINMQDDLVREQMIELKNGIGAMWSEEEIGKKAKEMVENLLEKGTL